MELSEQERQRRIEAIEAIDSAIAELEARQRALTDELRAQRKARYEHITAMARVNTTSVT